MVLASTSQFCPATLIDSLHSSFTRLQPQYVPLFRHPSTIPTKKLHFYIKSIQNHNSEVKSTHIRKPNNQFRNDLSTKSGWIQNWAETRIKPLQKHPQAVVDYRKGISSDEDEVGTSRSTGSSTMEMIVERLKKFGYIDDRDERKERPLPEKGSVEDIFYAEDGILPNSRGGLSLDLNKEARFPWEKPLEGKGGEGSLSERKRSKTSLAELTLPEGELRRLRHMAIRTKSKTKIGGAGITREVVEAIHEKWMTTEVVRLKCEGPPALNMKRVHEILERKTGGLVIWRSGTSVSLYRGISYEVPQSVKKPYPSDQSTSVGSYDKISYNSSSVPTLTDRNSNTQDTHEGVLAPIEKKKDTESCPEVKYEYEVDKLLDGLGPRYADWPGCDPLPVDADLLPGIVPGYKPPFRILPYGMRYALGYKEGTALRRLARSLPPHFALGRSRQHQGLAAAVVKLWEKSSIAKIALKRGVQLTSSERMAEDIKKLTGGSILSRNKDYLVLYRGKDFLSPEVAEALLERERMAKDLQDEEEKARLRASLVVSNIETVQESVSTGTLGETLEADARWGNKLDDDHENMMTRAAEVARHADVVRKLERKLSIADRKLMKAEKALAKVEDFLKPTEPNTDPESISDEERFMFRKLGLRMKAFLLLGRRGVFDGTVENMHLHWKYRELVKVIVNAKTFGQVKNVALSLEAESGGVLVSVDKISKGFAIIVYRGKDYKRPPTLRPKNLLTKRKALARSIELQRLEALGRHVSNLRRRMVQLKSELDQVENVKNRGDEDLYAKLDAAYSSEDEETEGEDDDVYLETYDSGADASSDEGHEANSSCKDEDDDEEDDEDDNPVNFLMNSCYNHQTGSTTD